MFRGGAKNIWLWLWLFIRSPKWFHNCFHLPLQKNGLAYLTAEEAFRALIFVIFTHSKHRHHYTAYNQQPVCELCTFLVQSNTWDSATPFFFWGGALLTTKRHIWTMFGVSKWSEQCNQSALWTYLRRSFCKTNFHIKKQKTRQINK